MSNYPNMSYCMCENTLNALRQVIDAMSEEGPDFIKDLNGDERLAYKMLYNSCHNFIVIADEIDEGVEPEDDMQPDEAQEWHDFGERYDNEF